MVGLNLDTTNALLAVMAAGSVLQALAPLADRVQLPQPLIPDPR